MTTAAFTEIVTRLQRIEALLADSDKAWVGAKEARARLHCGKTLFADHWRPLLQAKQFKGKTLFSVQSINEAIERTNLQ